MAGHGIPELSEMHRDMCRVAGEQSVEIDRLRAAIEAIKIATIQGRVCDDVAWFDTITTLHDYCCQVLNPNLDYLAEITPARKGGPTVTEPGKPCCKMDGSCCDFVCGN